MSLFLAANTQWVTTLTNAIYAVVGPVLTLAAVAGIIYAIVVGVKFVKADDKSARDEAKQKLISVIVGIVVTLLLIAFFFWLASQMGDADSWLRTLISDSAGAVRFIGRR